MRPQLLATSEPGLQEEKPYKVTSEKKLPYIPRRVNPKRKKALVNSLTILSMSVDNLVECLNNMNSSKKEKQIWKINKELKLWREKKTQHFSSLEGKKRF